MSSPNEKNFLDIVVDPPDANLDIVAVHGLNPFASGSNAISTWTATENNEDRNWLTNPSVVGFLPQRLPQARVMIFGYNSNSVFEGSSGTVNEHADNLLNFLRAERRRIRPVGRPIIFICHSLGGLLVKRAIVTAHSTERHKDIYSSTKGMVFFATPHGGSEKVVVGSIAAKIARTVLNQPDPRYLETLARNSLCAQQNRRDFIERTKDFGFISVVESLKTKGVMVVEKEDACLHLSADKEVRIFSNSDHVHVCKFWDPTSRMLRQILNAIEEMAEDAVESYLLACGQANAISPSIDSIAKMPTIRTAASQYPAAPVQATRSPEIHSDTPSSPPGFSREMRRLSDQHSDLDVEIPQMNILNLVISSRAASGGGYPNDGAGAMLPAHTILPSFVKSFEHYDYRADLEEILEGKLHNTCDWIFDTDEMGEWARARNSPVQILWLTGDPGIGKSTLASHIVDNILTRDDLVISRSTMVVYSFCHYQKNFTASMVLAVMIHQILRRYPTMQHFAFAADIHEGLDVTKQRIRKAKHRTPWPLWRLFNALISHSEMKQIVLIIDAFNVLEDRCQKDLLKLFRSRTKALDCDPQLKIFLTSLPDITTNNHQYRWLEDVPNSLKHMKASRYEQHFTTGIERLITREKALLDKVHGYLESDLLAVDQSLATYKQKTYLPVKLYFKHLTANPSDRTGKVLRNVSLDLSSIYTELISRLPQDILSTPSPLATFVAYAYTVLDLRELAFACKWYADGANLTIQLPPQRENPTEPQYVRHIEIEAQRYFPMLKIHGKQVTFFHDSIRDFILEGATHETHFLATSRREAHTQMAILCIGTILYKSKLQIPETWQSGSTSTLKPASHVFLSYAMRFWLSHLQEAVPNRTPIEDIDKRLITAVREMVKLWSPRSCARGFRAIMISEFNITHDFGTTFDDLSPLEVLSAVGLEPFLRLYVAFLGDEARRRLGYSVTVSNAIKLANAGGHHDCFEFLEEAFNITSLEGKQYSTVLQDSAFRGDARMLGKVMRLRRSMVKELVKALIAAFLNGHNEALDELTKDHSIFRDRDHFGLNALHALFAYNHGNFSDPDAVDDSGEPDPTNVIECVTICKYLIDHGVDPSSQDHNGYTALHWACRSRAFCQRAIIEVLVSHGANVHDQTFSGLTAFHLASYYSSRADVLSYLIELSSSDLIGTASHGGMTPLHWAISRPERSSSNYDTFEVLEYLLRRGADFHAKNIRGISPLEWGGKFRRDILQAIWSGLQGVDLISIRYHPSTGTAVLWAVWADVSSDALPQAVEALDERRHEARNDLLKSGSSRMQGHEQNAIESIHCGQEQEWRHCGSQQDGNAPPWLLQTRIERPIISNIDLVANELYESSTTQESAGRNHRQAHSSLMKSPRHYWRKLTRGVILPSKKDRV